nr:hypothetical protein [Halobacterium salinarum]
MYESAILALVAWNCIWVREGVSNTGDALAKVFCSLVLGVLAVSVVLFLLAVVEICLNVFGGLVPDCVGADVPREEAEIHRETVRISQNHQAEDLLVDRVAFLESIIALEAFVFS